MRSFINIVIANFPKIAIILFIGNVSMINYFNFLRTVPLRRFCLLPYFSSNTSTIVEINRPIKRIANPAPSGTNLRTLGRLSWTSCSTRTSRNSGDVRL